MLKSVFLGNILLISLSLSGQSNFAIGFTSNIPLTIYSLDKTSIVYNNGWDSVNLSFWPGLGASFGFRLHKSLSDNLFLGSGVSYESRMGKLKATMDGDNTFLIMSIKYHSLLIPLLIRSKFPVNSGSFFLMDFGINFKYDFIKMITAKNNFDEVHWENKIQLNNSNMIIGFQYFSLIFKNIYFGYGLNIQSDLLSFKNERRIDFGGGYFFQNIIPLKTSIISPTVTFLIN